MVFVLTACLTCHSRSNQGVNDNNNIIIRLIFQNNLKIILCCSPNLYDILALE